MGIGKPNVGPADEGFVRVVENSHDANDESMIKGVETVDPLIKSVGQISICVHDVEKSIEFYQGKLGLPLLFNGGNLAFLQCGHTRLMVSIPERPEFDHPSTPIYLDVENIDTAVEALRDRGVNFEDEPHAVGRLGSSEVWMAFFRDPDGNLLAVQSEVPVRV